MQRLLSIYGKLLLGIQEAMSAGVRKYGRGDTAPNWYRIEAPPIVADTEERDRLRGDLLREIDRFAEANEWSLPSRPVISLVESEGVPGEDPRVTGELVERFGRIEIADDHGLRLVDLAEPRATIGRVHEAPPRDFVPVHDASRSLSREHIRLRFDGSGWHAEVCGRNPTELNGRLIPSGSHNALGRGDSLVVAPHRITLVEEGPSCSPS